MQQKKGMPVTDVLAVSELARIGASSYKRVSYHKGATVFLDPLHYVPCP